MSFIQRIIGPRIPLSELHENRLRYAMPTILLSLAKICLLCALFLPFWHMELQAPQYPKGLHLTAYVNRVEGQVREINGLNHYIGMRKLEEAAALEKAVAVWGLIAVVLLVEGASFIHSKWAALLVLPAILFPAFFLLDLHWWMKDFGLNLDPHAPLSSSVKPFVPTILGVGTIGQFKTVAHMGIGLYLGWTSALLSIHALVFHRLAYKPLFERAVRKAELQQVVACAA
ncbi:MAG TPA: hypothetical protein VL282_05445 [Tepidisphaeraceae bacterium]|jgi:hypothetical protein|nr:hypothetical protein [Tepidisphaeraceae bacterium]